MIYLKNCQKSGVGLGTNFKISFCPCGPREHDASVKLCISCLVYEWKARFYNGTFSYYYEYGSDRNFTREPNDPNGQLILKQLKKVLKSERMYG